MFSLCQFYKCSFLWLCGQDEMSFTPVELEKLEKTLNMSVTEVNDVIGACEFIYQQVQYAELLLILALCVFSLLYVCTLYRL